MDDKRPDCIALSPTSPLLQKRTSARRRLSSRGTLLTFLLCAATLLFHHFTFALSVKVDGEPIGTVPDTQVLETLIDTAEGAVGSVLGRHYDVAERISYTLRLTSHSDVENIDHQQLEQDIFYHIDGVDMHYIVSIDGAPIGYVDDLEELQLAMDQRIEQLMGDGALSAAFLSDVSYDFQLVDLEQTLAVTDVQTFVETLSVETTVEITYTEIIPFEVDLILDDRRFENSVEVLQEGLDGEVEITALVTYIDGEVVGQTMVEIKVITEVVPEIVREGTQVRPLTASFGYYIWPTVGIISSLFGPRGGAFHQGLDIAAPSGTPVIAADGGEVFFAGWCSGYGNLIRILHDNGNVTYYAHLSSIEIFFGERVYRGQLIGRVGTTGISTGDHLHFEIHIDGIPVDPLLHLP